MSAPARDETPFVLWTAGVAWLAVVVLSLLAGCENGSGSALGGWLAFTALLVGTGLLQLRRWAERRQAEQRREDTRRDEQHAVDQAKAEEQRAVDAAHEQRAADGKRRPVDIANEIARRRGALGLAFLLLLPAPARAECVENEATAEVTCDGRTFTALTDEVLDLREQLAVTAARAMRAEKERDAARDRIAALEQLPPPEPQRPWLWAAGGVTAGMIVALAFVASAR